MKRERIEIERADGVTSWGLSQMVAQLTNIRGAKKAVLRALTDHYPNIWPKIETIADEAGCGTSRARTVMRELETEGYIRCLTDKRGGVARPAQYAISVAKIKALLEEQTQQPVLPSLPDTQQPVLPLIEANAEGGLTSGQAETNPTLVGTKPNTGWSEPNTDCCLNPTLVGANPTLSVAEHTINLSFQPTSEQRREQRSAHAL